jgi:MoaA/NifB/PqqE/SkfB family radical SAM enzyme
MTANLNQQIINLKCNCNQDCVYCQVNRFYDPRISPSTDKVKKMIRDTEKRSMLMFTGGGEPTMREDLFELLSYARDQGFAFIRMETNAVKLSDTQYVKKLKAAGLTECVVSLHSHIEQVSDIITSTPGTYKKTIVGLKNLEREKIPVTSILFVITSLNYAAISDFFDFISESFPYIKLIVLSFIRPIESDERSRKYTPKLSDIELELYKAIAHGRKLGIMAVIFPSCGIPFCYLQGPEELSHAIDFIKGVRKEDMEEMVHPKEKTKVDCCSVCHLNELCSGIHKSYLRIYGDSEFYPLFTDTDKSIEEASKQS